MKNYFTSSPAKWLMGYSAFILITSLVIVINRPDEISGSNQTNSIDSLKQSDEKGKNQTVAQVTEDTLFAHKSEIKKKAEEILLNFAGKNEAILFRDLDYQYSIDYQDNLIKKNVVFHFFIEDIFKEKKFTYIKGKKILSNMDVYLKLRCRDYSVEELKKFKFYIYVCANITGINKILFNANAVTAQSETGNENPGNSFDTLNEGLLITGECIDILPNDSTDQ